MSVERDPDRSTSSTLLNGVLGAVAGVVLFFLPFSPFLGGTVAGYLEGGSTRRGATVGAIAGVVTILPLLVLARVVVWFVEFVDVLALPLTILVGLVAVFALGYVLALSVLGGIAGVFLRESLSV